MKKIILIIVLIATSCILMAHEGGHGTPLKSWTLKSNNTSFEADFIKVEDSKVWLSDKSHQVIEFAISDFTVKDQEFILNRNEIIHSLNSALAEDAPLVPLTPSKILFVILGVLLMLFSVIKFYKKKKKINLSYGLVGILLIFLSSCNNDKTAVVIATVVPANVVSYMQSLFVKFSGVSTSSDDTYFYISSNGLPNHNMMVGITNWQQQVPINQNYTGSNSWAIPLQPVLSSSPLSTKTNLLKGAIAVGVNGIPIFNPLNNRSEDANAIGELDQWGGHCGRADDYHYHLPPTHLQSIVGSGQPIAYAVDGFPIYGPTTDILDENLGKFNADGSYQYHTTSTYPYFIAGMRGVVKLDPNSTAPENQVLPQAMTKELRPALTPLPGAVITDFKAIGNNGYSLT